MPVLCAANTSLGLGPPNHSHYMVVCRMGLNMVGPLQKAPEGYTHLLVAIDKFSKWIEARPINRIKSEQAVLFFTDIIHRFGVPNTIITDNGT